MPARIITISGTRDDLFGVVVSLAGTSAAGTERPHAVSHTAIPRCTNSPNPGPVAC